VGSQDVVIAMDGSGSLAEDQFAGVRNFSAALVRKFNSTAYGRNATRMGIIQFGNGDVYGVDRVINGAVKVKAISADFSSEVAAALEQQSGFANIAQAMGLAEKMFGEDVDVQRGRERLLVIVTASNPAFHRESLQKARELEQAGIRTFVVTISPSSRGARAAQELASKPWSANSLHVNLGELPSKLSSYVSLAVTHSCKQTESPSRAAAESEERGFELLREQQACSSEPRTILDRYATDPAHCASLASNAGASYFSYGTGPRDGFCYKEEASDDDCGGTFRRSFSDFYKLLAATAA